MEHCISCDSCDNVLINYETGQMTGTCFFTKDKREVLVHHDSCDNHSKNREEENSWQKRTKRR